MTESNFNQRSEILASERAKALKMQLEAIKHQGSKGSTDKNGELSRRSNEVVAERNSMSVKNVQRYLSLNNLGFIVITFAAGITANKRNMRTGQRRRKKRKWTQKKNALRAEDIAKGVFVPVNHLPKAGPKIAVKTA